MSLWQEPQEKQEPNWWVCLCVCRCVRLSLCVCTWLCGDDREILYCVPERVRVPPPPRDCTVRPLAGVSLQSQLCSKWVRYREGGRGEIWWGGKRRRGRDNLLVQIWLQWLLTRKRACVRARALCVAEMLQKIKSNAACRPFQAPLTCMIKQHMALFRLPVWTCSLYWELNVLPVLPVCVCVFRVAADCRNTPLPLRSKTGRDAVFSTAQSISGDWLWGVLQCLLWLSYLHELLIICPANLLVHPGNILLLLSLCCYSRCNFGYWGRGIHLAVFINRVQGCYCIHRALGQVSRRSRSVTLDQALAILPAGFYQPFWGRGLNWHWHRNRKWSCWRYWYIDTAPESWHLYPWHSV